MAFIFFMTSGYKESPNCRAECEYARQQGKLMIPIVAQEGYKPDGWLGLVLGSKLWIDFTDSAVGGGGFNCQFAQLHNQLSKGGVQANWDTTRTALRTLTSARHMPAEDESALGRRYLAEWDLERVGEWLQSCGLGAAAPNFAEQMINGAALLRIEDLLGREAHSLQMFTEQGALWQMLGLQPLGHRVRFADELRLACGRSDEQLQLLRDLRNPSTKFLKPVQLPSATSIAHPAAQGSSAGAADKQQLAV